MTAPPRAQGRPRAQAAEWRGMALGMAGVAIFGLTLPATRIAVAEWSPVVIGLGRAVVAALFAGLILAVTRQPLPSRGDLKKLVVVALGVIFGFPLLSAIALQSVPASHGGVVLGILPLASAAAGAVIGRERPSLAFWIVGLLGSAAVVAFALLDGGGGLHVADILLFVAVVSAAIGYAAGGELSRTLGGWQVICWALVISLPGLVPPVLWFLPRAPLDAAWQTWAGFAYVALFSQLIGFFVWYKGLALGGIARVSQTQLVQPFVTIAAAAVLAAEPITLRTVGFAALVIGLVALGRKMPIERPAD